MSTIALHPHSRLDAKFWIRVQEEAAKRGIREDDKEGMRALIMTIEALYERPGAHPKGEKLGDLIEKARAD